MSFKPEITWSAFKIPASYDPTLSLETFFKSAYFISGWAIAS